MEGERRKQFQISQLWCLFGDMAMRNVLPIAVLLIAGAALGQTEPKPPCAYTGELLHKRNGRITFFTSDEMMARATYKQDIAGSVKQADIKGTAIVDLLIAPDGHVVCTRSLYGHPMIRKLVEDALRHWKFSSEGQDGKNVAYLGRMVFTLCQISCGESGPSMTIVR